MSNDGLSGEFRRKVGVPSLDDGRIALYSSKETAPRIDGMRDQIADLTKADTLFVAVEDFEARPGAPNEGRNLKNFMQKTLPKDVYQNVFSKMDNAEWKDFAARLHSPLATGKDVNRDAKLDFGIISVGRRNESKEELISGLTGVKKEALSGIPGTDKDYQDFTVLHEARHVGQPAMNMPIILREMDADRAAFSGTNRDGKPLSPEMQTAIVEARAVGAMTGPGSELDVMMCTLKTAQQMCGMPTHATHVALEGGTQDGLPNLAAGPQAKEWSGMMRTKIVVNGVMGALAVQADFKEIMDDKSLSEKQRAERIMPVIETMNSPIKMGERGAFASATNVLGSKAVLDGLKDKTAMNDPGIQAYVARVDTFFDKHYPDHKQQPEYLATQKEMAPFVHVLDMGAGSQAQPQTQPAPSPGQPSGIKPPGS